MAFDLDPSYKQVPERIADFKAKHPDGCLRPVDPSRPFWFEEREGQTFIVYAAAAYRTPEDPLPGIGLAWEPFPGRTPYTKQSELQNAETSAWGRAIVAVLASESKAVASAEDVRNRAADHAEPERKAKKPAEPVASEATHIVIRNTISVLTDEQRKEFAGWYSDQGFPSIKQADRLTERQAVAVLDKLDTYPGEPVAGTQATTLQPVEAKAPSSAPVSPPGPAERAKAMAAKAALGAYRPDPVTSLQDAFPGSEVVG